MQKVVVISGVTQGLGRAMVAEFAIRGIGVLGCGRSAFQIGVLSAELGDPHDFEVVDVVSDEAVGRWAEGLLERYGPPDILLNNAALMNESAPLWEVPAAEMSTLLAVNLGGTVNLIRHFVPAMISRGRGMVVNFSSGYGRATAPLVAPYCATKWGVEGLTRALAAELPPGLAAVALNPGIINTEMLHTCWGERADAYPDAAVWAQVAVPFILGLGRQDNGRTCTVPL